MKASLSPAHLLITNLRLLDIPELPDIPITTDALSTGKNKSKIFEHITYHLFRLYNQSDCEAKFQSCWPAYEPAQSKAFRAVALSLFSDLRRNGQLPGNTVVRKSTLEDCQGERYEELMLAFSTMVLRSVSENKATKNTQKTVAAATTTPTVYKLATDENVSLEDLQPLLLAYQSSLSHILSKRTNDKAQWAKLDSLLVDEKKSLNSRLESEESATPAVSKEALKEEESIRQRWKGNWVTDDSLLNNLISGGLEHETNNIFRLGFENALKSMTVDSGDKTKETNGEQSLGDATDGGDGLHQAITNQAERLERWRSHPSLDNVKRESAWKGHAHNPSNAMKSVGEQIDFEKHQNLSVFNSSQDGNNGVGSDAAEHRTELEVIMGNFERELKNVGSV